MSSSRIFDIKRPLIMAHRGDSENTPENTMIALESAVRVGVDVLESDIRLTKDDEIVLFHDADLKRTTSEEGTIRSHTLKELMEIDLGANFTTDNGITHPFRNQDHKIVTLLEAFERFPEMIFNLDIKDTFPAAPMELARIISKMNRKDTVIVGSFHDSQLEHFRQLAPDVPTSAHPGEVKRFVLNSKFGLPRINTQDIQFIAFQVPVKSGPLTVVTKKFVRKAHELDLAVHVWTINEEATMIHLLDLGVDGIFTDQPALLREVLEKRGFL